MDGSEISDIERFGIGQPVRRREDRRFITGAGRFTDDINLPGQAWGYVLRSPHAHARIRAIDLGAATAAPGILGIFTIADLDADGVAEIPTQAKVPGKGGSEMFAPTRSGSGARVCQGLGQAVLENTAYDTASGQFLAGSFMDYAMPRAEDLPPLEVSFNPVANPSSELGVKGIGEAGTCGAPPSIVSAVCDALGIAHLDMPLLPEKIWHALQQTGLRAAAD